MPFESWALLILSVGIGLALELRFYVAQRGRRAASDQPSEPEKSR